MTNYTSHCSVDNSAVVGGAQWEVCGHPRGTQRGGSGRVF